MNIFELAMNLRMKKLDHTVKFTSYSKVFRDLPFPLGLVFPRSIVLGEAVGRPFTAVQQFIVGRYHFRDFNQR